VTVLHRFNGLFGRIAEQEMCSCLITHAEAFQCVHEGKLTACSGEVSLGTYPATCVAVMVSALMIAAVMIAAVMIAAVMIAAVMTRLACQ
jgi:hypothetical protein